MCRFNLTKGFCKKFDLSKCDYKDDKAKVYIARHIPVAISNSITKNIKKSFKDMVLN